jgi:hypothetical protein
MHTTSSDPHLTPQLQLGGQYLNLTINISLHYSHVYMMPFTPNPLHGCRCRYQLPHEKQINKRIRHG